jgi:S-adenosylmethionine hydrolase
MAIITLTTDFGWSDYYVGAMKGVIYQISPQSTVVDITHDVPACNILSGSLVLREIWRTFPPKTIHVGIVDPGVGSARPIILAKYAGQFFLVPDNGLVTLIHQMYRPEQVNEVINTGLFCQPVLPTFHARDIFAPVAAHLAKGLDPDQVGPRINMVRLLELPLPQPDKNGTLVGSVIHIDHFGNLVSNITPEQLRVHVNHGFGANVYFGSYEIGPIRKTFADVPEKSLVAYIGSAGLLEIAVNQGRADRTLNATLNNTVEVRQ